ncbi:MAG: hypothetical protein B0A82_03065 [Alkalinema sp. CACIAM 70d]|nr:MAG: hypothetical protein B0A82_03065 [Alkalinema sp. CACIAM 70d]
MRILTSDRATLVCDVKRGGSKFWGFLNPQQGEAHKMAKETSDRSDRSIEHGPQRLQIHLIGHKAFIQDTINQFHAHRIADRIHWSKPMKIIHSDGQYISILSRERQR